MASFDVVTFLSDFGRQDVFVGVVHGVLLKGAPHVSIIDLTHDVPPQDVRAGALMLERAVPHLPVAVHLAVVDPGVGTRREAVAATTERGDVLVGPDNGLLDLAARRLGGTTAVHRIPTPEDASRTFHGRDVFAPAAARIAAGTPAAELGPARDGLVPCQLPFAVIEHDEIHTEVLLVDHFGNLQLGIKPGDLPVAFGKELTVTWEHHQLTLRRVDTFGDLAEGELGLLVDSDGHLAIVVTGGSAAKRVGLKAGDRLVLGPEPSSA